MNKTGLQKFIGLVYTHPELPVVCLLNNQIIRNNSVGEDSLGYISDACISELAYWNDKYYNNFNEFWDAVKEHLIKINDKFDYNQEEEKLKRDINYIVGHFWKDYICVQIKAGVEKDDS